MIFQVIQKLCLAQTGAQMILILKSIKRKFLIILFFFTFNSVNSQVNLDKFDYVVILMMENRSFDNMLGYLYEDGVPLGQTFNGL